MKITHVLFLAVMSCGPQQNPVVTIANPILDMSYDASRSAPQCVEECGKYDACCPYMLPGAEFAIMACVTTRSNIACGSCKKTTVCNANFPDCCSAGVDDSSCTNIQGDPNNCGSCGNVCNQSLGEVCSAGHCKVLR